jgi:hypothetical protein
MNRTEKHERFEELRAGRALGDLSDQEFIEVDSLARELDLQHDFDFDLLAASIEVELLLDRVGPMPASLKERLHKQADSMSAPVVNNVISPPASVWGKVLRSPLTGWAAAAMIAISMFLTNRETPVTPTQAAAELRMEARDLIERDFSGLGNFKDAGGKVIWSDQLQKGYMTLSGIPANDPKKAQYQLWIVDPKRDEAPIDGGVFDIPSDGSPVVVPIAAKLALTQPQAFVITLEQPGGVVKSKREKDVALAKG